MRIAPSAVLDVSFDSDLTAPRTFASWARFENPKARRICRVRPVIAWIYNPTRITNLANHPLVRIFLPLFMAGTVVGVLYVNETRYPH
jgi:hypothetical protein